MRDGIGNGYAYVVKIPNVLDWVHIDLCVNMIWWQDFNVCTCMCESARQTAHKT